MVRRITTREYHRRVFNKALLECFCNVHGQVLNGACAEDAVCDKRMADMAKKIGTAFFTDELKLGTSTVSQTKARLAESVHFIHEAIEIAEEIADDKAAEAEEEKMEMYDDQEVELSQEDNAVIDQLFASKNPTPQIDKIRDATVQALVAEEKKSEEIRDAIDIAKSQVTSGDNPKAMEETVRRINAVGPTSLMNAIMNNISAQAVKSVNEAGNFSSVGDVMRENADEIKSRAVIVYSLYETCSVFGIHKYTQAEVKRIAQSIYAEK